MKLRDGAPREVYAGLRWIQRERGYKDAWVDYGFKEIFGGWPCPQTPVEPEPPTEELAEWFYRKIRLRRAKKRREELQAENTRVNGHDLPDVAKGTKSPAQPTTRDNPHAIDCACWECIVKLQYSIMQHDPL